MKDENYWKELALSRRLENKALKARIIEIIDGREKWKAKAMKAQDENIILIKSIDLIKKKLHQIELL
jgi:non-ribosomal peptide synthetase component E (peptide arylation enzyme)